MRFYIYLMLVTFDLSIFKILKNALIFSALGIKRNLMAGLGILLLLALHVFLMILLLPEVIITVILPIVYIFAAIGFITAYAVYPVIDRYMIAPYRKPRTEDDDTEDDLDDGDGIPVDEQA